jgi:hypothetical protein
MDAVTYSEEAASHQVQNVQRSHLSIEVGHFYMDQLKDGDGVEERVREQYDRVAPIAMAAKAGVVSGTSTPRISTCFLVDDYFSFNRSLRPRSVIRRIQKVATEHGIPIDYVVREAACAVADGVPLAELTAGHLLAEPSPGTNGSRPPASETGWLCNGERSAEPGTTLAMHPTPWQPPLELSKFRHSIFVDVEMWNERDELVNGKKEPQRTWSCPFLAAVWHLLRLGMLRDNGKVVATPTLWKPADEWPEHWSDLPAVIQLNPDAAPFAAYRSASILPHDYLHIEHASRVILDHLQLDSAVTDQVAARAAKEGIQLPAKVTSRMSHFFIEGS